MSTLIFGILNLIFKYF